MHKKLMKTGGYTALCLGLAFAGMTFLSCNDDEPAVSLQQPALTCDLTYNTLSVSWENVPQAVQYGYFLYDANNEVITGDVTTKTSFFVGNLQKLTDYKVVVYAYSALDGNQITSSIQQDIQTPYYTQLDHAGTYESAMINNGSWTAPIKEERTEGHENEFGIFTIKDWYGAEGYDLQFTVNTANNTIHILNGTEDEPTGYIKVATGQGFSTIRDGLLIDESRSFFDYEAHTLTIHGQATRGNREGDETFTWNE